MKSRELKTTPVLVVSNYSITNYASGKYLHKFTPENTNTIYQFVANEEPLLDEGERYNIGFTEDNNINLVDIAACAKADQVNPIVSHYVARQLGEQIRAVETRKSDDRVSHTATTGAYLGKKYAWRIYGMAIARGTFDEYLSTIEHPSINCITDSSPSIAYLDQNIEEAMDNFIQSCEKVGVTGNRFSSPFLPNRKWFTVKGISAITDKK